MGDPLPKWGVCGHTDDASRCRWFGAVCSAQPGPLQSPVRQLGCRLWEPPEGRICGNCEHWIDKLPEALWDMTRWRVCSVGESCFEDDPGARHRLWTCQAWRWKGKGA